MSFKNILLMLGLGLALTATSYAHGTKKNTESITSVLKPLLKQNMDIDTMAAKKLGTAAKITD